MSIAAVGGLAAASSGQADAPARPTSESGLVEFAPTDPGEFGVEHRDGFTLRNVPPFPGISAGCQVLGTSGFLTGPAFRRADNFKPLANSTINAVSWSGYYRMLTATTAGTAPGGETFVIRILNDNAGVPGTVHAGPFTVMPTSTPDGTFGTAAGAPVLYDYVATLPESVPVTGGNCYWLELQNTNTGGQRWFWHSSTPSPGDTVQYSMGAVSSTYGVHNQGTGDLAFCLDIELDNLINNPCPTLLVPAACANPDVNGQPRSGATSGLSSNLQGSSNLTGGLGVGTKRAEAFRLTNAGNIENVCFYAFWNTVVTGVGGGFPGNPDLELTYYSNDPSTGLPGTILAQFVVGQPGVTLVWDTTGIHRIDHPPVAVAADTCYHISIAYLTIATDPARQSRFIWGNSNSAGTNTDGIYYNQNIATNPVGNWTTANSTAPGRGLSYLFNIGESVLPACTPPPVSNVSCETASPLTLNGPPAQGSNVAVPFSVLPPCQFDLVFGGIVWYSFVGDGNTVTLSTCNSTLFGDPNINVWCAPSGCAGPLNCIIGNDDQGAACGFGALAAAVTFPTVNGQTYYVTVHGTNNSTTVFSLAATSNLIPATAQPCTSFERCELSAEPSDASEPEVCVVEQLDNVNRTCDTATPYPAFGTVVAGRVSTYLNGTTQTRDFDYWDLPAVAVPTVITWRINAEFPAFYQVQRYAVDCTSTATVLAGATRTACFNEFLGEATLQPGGIHRFLISVPDFQGMPCPNFNDYRLTISIAPTGTCCVPASVCFVTTAGDCTTQAGDFTLGASCDPDPCTAVATGACCSGATCSVDTEANCNAGTFTRYAGNGTACNAVGNFTTPCCKADYNQSGSVTVQDIFDFLAGYFTANPQADINGGGTSVQDIFDFLAAYFAGCV